MVMLFIAICKKKLCIFKKFSINFNYFLATRKRFNFLLDKIDKFIYLVTCIK